MKRSGTTLPPTHQIMMDVKLDLLNLYDNQEVDVSKRLDLLHERIHLLDQLEGKDTDSRLKGFLLFNGPMAINFCYVVNSLPRTFGGIIFTWKYVR